MDATKVRKSLEYIDELISACEKDRGFSQQTWIDARKGYNYLNYCLSRIARLSEFIDEAGDKAESASSFCSQAKGIMFEEPNNAHLL